jgi:hypothetical protein
MKKGQDGGTVRLNNEAFKLLKDIANIEERTDNTVLFRALRLYASQFHANKFPKISPPDSDLPSQGQASPKDG